MDEYEASGLRQKQFCEEKGIDFNAFKNGRNRVAYHKHKKSKKTLPVTKVNVFSEIKFNHQKKASLKLTHPNGIECTLPTTITDEEVINLIKGDVSTFFRTRDYAAL